MSDIQIILKLNQEINDYIKGQREVLASYEKEDLNYAYSDSLNILIEKNKKLVKELYSNLERLEGEKDKILGL